MSEFNSYSAILINLIAVVCFLWLVVLSVWVYRINSHYKRLIGGSRGVDLKSVFERVLGQQRQLGEQAKKLEEELDSVKKVAQKYVQKVGLVRFNPYSGTGGNQSFALCLLNEKDSGVVLLSLHGREGTRIYIKTIVMGISELELSKEEKQAIVEAKR